MYTTEDSFPVEDIVAYGEYFGFSPVRAGGTLSSSTVISEIIAGRPIYASMLVESDNGKKYGHAMVLRGFDTLVGVYSIWNVVDEAYAAMDISSKQYYDATRACRCTWRDSIYGW